MQAPARSTSLGVLGVLAWLVCVVLLWAARPLDDRVPVGIDNTLAPPQPVTVTVRCNALFANSVRDDSPLPPLKAQPSGFAALAYGHTPCASIHSQARRLFVFDVAFGLVAVAVLVVLELRRQRPSVAASATLSSA